MNYNLINVALNTINSVMVQHLGIFVMNYKLISFNNIDV